MECDSLYLFTVRSKRRRRRRRGNQSDKEIPEAPPIICPFLNMQHAATGAAHPSECDADSREPTLEFFRHTLTSSIQLSLLVLLLVLVVSAGLAASASPPCDKDSWWDSFKDRCIACTTCTGDMIPLRPCQIHRDTICGSIYDLKIDWVVLAKTEPNWKERRKSDSAAAAAAYGLSALEQQLSHEEMQRLHDETIPMDWQTAALFTAVLACLLFFIVAACILIHHMRQWRRMERRLDQDVEELSTKLMAKLAEVQSLDGGTFFIGNAEALQIPTTFQPQHVLLPPEKRPKHAHIHQNNHSCQHERHFVKAGNVYIENGSKA